jgi:hypothetical protein
MWVAVLLVVTGATAANAAITLAGQVFDDNAFVDGIVGMQGSWTNPTAVIGPNIMTYAQNNPPDPAAYLLVAFTDNSIVNGAGADFIVYEAGGSTQGSGELVYLTINGETHKYPTSYSGVGSAHQAFIDLTDFGVALGDRVSVIQLWGIYSGLSGTEYMAIGALNNGAPIPAPAAVWLVGLGLVTLRGARRNRRA